MERKRRERASQKNCDRQHRPLFPETLDLFTQHLKGPCATSFIWREEGKPSWQPPEAKRRQRSGSVRRVASSLVLAGWNTRRGETGGHLRRSRRRNEQTSGIGRIGSTCSKASLERILGGSIRRKEHRTNEGKQGNRVAGVQHPSTNFWQKVVKSNGTAAVEGP